MLRRTTLALAGLLLPHGHRPEPDSMVVEPQASVATAQRQLRPLLFLVPFESRSRRSLIELGQQRTFRDPLINELVSARFVPVRLQRSTDNLDLLAQLGAPTTYGAFWSWSRRPRVPRPDRSG